MHRRLRSAAFAACSIIAVLACAPAAAHAAFGITSLDVTPSTTQAGGHPNLTVAAEFATGSGGPDVRDVVLRLPPGLVGNPTATDATCTIAQFDAGSCPATSRVGSASARALALEVLPITADGGVFNLAPRGDEPARLGFDLRAVGLIPIRLEAPIRLRADDVSLESTITGIPREPAGPATVTGMTFTLDGLAPSGRPFLTNPTACRPAAVSMRATSYDGESGSASDAFTPTGCASVPFTPGVGVDMVSRVARTPTQTTVSLGVPGAELPVRQSTVRRVQVVLPEGVAMNAPVGDGLEGCPDGAVPACPAASDIGEARVDTPLVGTLSGDVFLGTPTAADPYRLIVVLAKPGIRLVLRGSVALDPATGRITTTFDELPQVPFTRFALTFRGGDRAVLLQSDRCGTHTATATFTPWSGTANRTASSAYETTDCAGALTPGFAVSSSTSQAGASPAVAMTVERPDRQPVIRDLDIAMPPGLLGRLASVPVGAPVGSVDVLSGAGGAPLSLTGEIRLAEPRGDELAALLVRVPAKVGPFDLGTVELRSGMRLRPDGGLDVRTRGLPSMIGGIPLEVRRMVLRLDRRGFLLNPTQCGTPPIGATVNGVAVSAPYPVTGCERLAFTPRLRATLAGGRAAARKGGRPTLTTVITQGDGEAAIRRAAVTLPSTLAANLAAVGAACKAPDPAACPASATVGSAEAVTPLLAGPLRGPVVLMAGESVLPKLVVLLRGQIPLRLDADIAFDAQKRTVATFGALPDVPVTRFALTLDGGPNGLSSAATDLCGAAQQFSGAFTSWAGGRSAAGARATVEGCEGSPVVTVSASRVGRSGPQVVVRIRRGSGGPALRGATVVLPESLRARRRPLVRIDGTRRATRRGVTLGNGLASVRRGARRSIELRFPAGSLRPLKSLRTALAKGRRPELAFTVDVRTADGDTWSVVRSGRARR